MACISHVSFVFDQLDGSLRIQWLPSLLTQCDVDHFDLKTCDHKIFKSNETLLCSVKDFCAYYAFHTELLTATLHERSHLSLIFAQIRIFVNEGEENCNFLCAFA